MQVLHVELNKTEGERYFMSAFDVSSDYAAVSHIYSPASLGAEIHAEHVVGKFSMCHQKQATLSLD